MSDLAMPGLGLFIFAALAVPALRFYMVIGVGWLCIPLGAALLLARPRFRSACALLASQTIAVCSVNTSPMTPYLAREADLPALLRKAHPQIYSTALLPGRCTDSPI